MIELCTLKGKTITDVKSVSIGLNSIVVELENTEKVCDILAEEIFRFKMAEDFKDPFKAGETEVRLRGGEEGCFVVFSNLTYQNR